MKIRYHVTVDRQGDDWHAVCPALRSHGAFVGGETREEALTHIENAILMILSEMNSAGVSPPPDQQVAGSIQLTIEVDNVDG
jgi:predicted RNase H-like HicB family nuclease